MVNILQGLSAWILYNLIGVKYTFHQKFVLLILQDYVIYILWSN